MVELVDTRDLKSLGQKWLCGFESRSRHILSKTFHYEKKSYSVVLGSFSARTDILFF